MHLVGILCSLGTAVFRAMAVIMFKMSGDVLSPTALNRFKAIVTLVLLVPTLWIAGVPMFPSCPAVDNWCRSPPFSINWPRSSPLYWRRYSLMNR